MVRGAWKAMFATVRTYVYTAACYSLLVDGQRFILSRELLDEPTGAAPNRAGINCGMAG